MPVTKLWVKGALLIDFPGRLPHIEAVVDRREDYFWQAIPDKEYFFRHIHPLLAHELLRM